jgi:hypothetical protein
MSAFMNACGLAFFAVAVYMNLHHWPVSALPLTVIGIALLVYRREISPSA